MVAFEDVSDVPEKRRIRYASRDEENGRESDTIAEIPRLIRRNTSASNLSTHSDGQRKRSAELVLPIAYRTLYVLEMAPSTQ
jgi:hypothetical protein